MYTAEDGAWDSARGGTQKGGSTKKKEERDDGERGGDGRDEDETLVSLDDAYLKRCLG